MELVKVQMPVDMARAISEQKMFIDPDKPAMVYAKGEKGTQLFYRGTPEGDRLFEAMEAECDGQGSMKCYFFARMAGGGRGWQIDFARGSQNFPDW